MKLTKNFQLIEFIESKFYNEEHQAKVWQSFNDNKDELLPSIQKLANQLQVLRDAIDRPVHVNIGYRPLWWELQQGRSGRSQHVKGKAADIRVKGLEPYLLASVIENLIVRGEMLQGGVGVYNSWVHYDIRKTRARW
jgi:uncharacterized protein YcbK (DUF882 family)